KLFRIETVGTARRAPLAQSLETLPAQRAVPAGRRSAAHPELPGHTGLREPPLQVLRGQQTPAFHFIASQNSLCCCLHTPRAVIQVPERLQHIKKHSCCKLLFTVSAKLTPVRYFLLAAVILSLCASATGQRKKKAADVEVIET